MTHLKFLLPADAEAEKRTTVRASLEIDEDGLNLLLDDEYVVAVTFEGRLRRFVTDREFVQTDDDDLIVLDDE